MWRGEPGPSDRVKTDRKDAERLAGQLKAITVPSPRAEAARELVRGHDSARRDLRTTGCRRCCCGTGSFYDDATTWARSHGVWLSRQAFAEPVSDLAFANLLAAVDGLTARKAALAERISRLELEDEWWPTVARLRSFRGIDTLSALAIHLELAGDWQRFASPRSLGMWLGLTLSLEQSGQSSHAGSITKTGSMLARRLLVEAAWHYSRPPRSGATLRNRQAGQPDHVLQISNRAHSACTASITRCAAAANTPT